MKKKDKNKPVAEPELQEAEPLEPEVSDAPAEEEHVATAEEWQAALELAVKQRDEFKDSLLRAQADFQNFKRRNQTARSDGYDDGVREAIAAMLPAIDNLERAIDAAEKTEDEAAKALADGVKMTLNTLTPRSTTRSCARPARSRGRCWRCSRRGTRSRTRSSATRWSRWPSRNNSSLS